MKHKVIFEVGCFVVLASIPVLAQTVHKEDDNPKQSVQESLKFESYNYDVITEGEEFLVDEIPAGRLMHKSGSGVLPVAGNNQGVNILRDSLMQITGLAFGSGDRPEPTLGKHEKITGKKTDVAVGAEISSDLSLCLLNPRLAVFENEKYTYYSGGAHGTTERKYVNYSMTEGKILHVDDILLPGYSHKLVPFLIDAIADQNVPLLVSKDDITVPGLMKVDEDGLTFVYPPYEIAPYSAGFVEAKVYYYQLQSAGILNPGAYTLITGQTLMGY